MIILNYKTHNNNKSKEDWQNSLINHFIDMVKASDGDFNVLKNLSNSTYDPESVQKTIEFLSRNPQGKRAFQERPRLENVDFEKLQALEKNTLGYCYAKHTIENNLKTLQGRTVNNDCDFLRAHISETHDIWHVVTGSDTTIYGEIQLEAFCVAQFSTSRFWLSLVTKNLFKAMLFDIEVSSGYMDALTNGWLMGKQAKPLFGLRWDELWETPLNDLRDSLNIVNPID
ncbi:MAG: Coq4 family protein [Prochloraceae cyanobacterium]|nr:Coq4 family protein [Prochloraceae cyanobacterium]